MTIGYEVSRPRARYAREKLRVNVFYESDQIHGPFDAVVSSHVLEHVPSPPTTIKWTVDVVKPGGVFIAITPNGSDGCLRKDPRGLHRRWGRACTPIYLSDEFYRCEFASQLKLLASVPYNLPAMKGSERQQDLMLDLTGWELFFAVVV